MCPDAARASRSTFCHNQKTGHPSANQLIRLCFRCCEGIWTDFAPLTAAPPASAANCVSAAQSNVPTTPHLAHFAGQQTSGKQRCSRGGQVGAAGGGRASERAAVGAGSAPAVRRQGRWGDVGPLDCPMLQGFFSKSKHVCRMSRGQRRWQSQPHLRRFPFCRRAAPPYSV